MIAKADGDAAKFERRALALACIMQACGMVEGFASDVCEQCCGSYRNRRFLPAVNQRELVFYAGRMWEQDLGPKGQNGVDRWATLLMQLGFCLNRKSDACKNMTLLGRLRNQFTHAEPMVHPTEDVRHLALERDLKGLFDLNDAPHEGFLPAKVLSVGCAEWAFATALAFCREVAGIIGYPDWFAGVIGSVAAIGGEASEPAATLTIAHDWLPTPAAIGSLPAPLRDYIGKLETTAGPRHLLPRLIAAKQTAAALAERVRELEQLISAAKK